MHCSSMWFALDAAVQKPGGALTGAAVRPNMSSGATHLFPFNSPSTGRGKNSVLKNVKKVHVWINYLDMPLFTFYQKKI